jgi:MerR family transcriptional regulator, heat shock protein HspR
VSYRRRPVFMIGIAAELIGVHPQTLRMYEQKGLLKPRKSIKNTRLYSQEDIELGQQIQYLTQELGLNLAGVKKILELEKKVAQLEAENRKLAAEMEAREAEYRKGLLEVHRSYKRELVVVPRAELARHARREAASRRKLADARGENARGTGKEDAQEKS